MRLDGQFHLARRIYRSVLIEGNSPERAAAENGISKDEALNFLELYSELGARAFDLLAPAVNRLSMPMNESLLAVSDFAESVFGDGDDGDYLTTQVALPGSD